MNETELDFLATPLSKTSEGVDWDADTMEFGFELGLEPQFEVNLKVLKKVTHYQIEEDAKMIESKIKYYQKLFGELISQKEVKEDSKIMAHFANEAVGLDVMTAFELKDVKSEEAKKTLLGATVTDGLEFPFKDFFLNSDTGMVVLEIDEEEESQLVESNTIQIAIKDISGWKLAPLNQELFDKVYPESAVTSEAAFKELIVEELQKEIEPFIDRKLLDDISELLIEKTSFKLPENFLKKWLQKTAEEPLTEEDVAEQYPTREKNIRWNLIEKKLVKEHQIKVESEEVLVYAKEIMRKQMQQDGYAPEEDELVKEVTKIFSKREEFRRLFEQLMIRKILAFFKENAPLKTKKLSFDDFLQEAYPKKE